MSQPARIFLWSGLLWQGALRAYWVSLVVRLTVDLGLSSLQLVLLGTVMEACLLISEIPTGVVADTFSRKWSIVIGFVGVGVAQLAAGLVEAYPLILATQALWGVTYTFRSGADTAWITDELGGPEEVEALILRRGRLQLVVSIVAILGGAALGRLTSLSTSIALSGLILIAVGVWLAARMPETGFRRRRATSGGGMAASFASFRSTLTAGGRATLSRRPLRVLVAVLVLSGLASEAVDRLDIRRLDDLGLSADLDEIVVVGAIAATEAAFGALLLWLTRHRVAGRNVVFGLAGLLAASAIGIAALGLVAILPVAIAGLIMQGGLRSAAQPLQVAWANAHADTDVRATVHSFIEQANSVGEIGGGVLLGLLAAATTVPTAMTASAVLVVVAALVASTGAASWSEPAAAGVSVDPGQSLSRED